MGSVSSVSPGITDLLQTFSNVEPSVLSSPGVVAALEKAPAADVVQLSLAATQLEGIDAMFGLSNGSSSGSSSDMTSLLASLEPAITGSAAPATANSGSSPAASASSTATTADQIASARTFLQTEETAALFGTGSAGSLSNSLFNNSLLNVIA